MVFNQITSIPVIIERVNLETLNFRSLFEKYNLSFGNIMIFTGTNFSAEITNRIYSNNKDAFNISVINNIGNDKNAIDELSNKYRLDEFNLVVGIGGGRILDSAKYFASKMMINFISIPTIISNDSIISPISILENNGRVEPFASGIPSGVLIDREVISKSPHKFILSGIGDILANRSAIYDWDLAISKGRAKSNSLAKILSTLSVTNIINYEICQDDVEFIESFINSTIIGGMAMNISGDTRPSSGAEHLISHVLIKYNLSSYSHGFQVGSVTPFILWLHKETEIKYFRYFKENRFYWNFTELLDRGEISLENLFQEARIIRNNRYTILNEYSDADLVCCYEEYLRFMEKI
ncbi:MAG: iron-containing alcohol dehydrogenase [Ignavibacteriales bacterium]